MEMTTVPKMRDASTQATSGNSDVSGYTQPSAREIQLLEELNALRDIERELLSMINSSPIIQNIHMNFNRIMQIAPVPTQNSPINLSQNAEAATTTTSNGAHFSDTEEPNNNNSENGMISIGPNNTRIPSKIYDSIDWSSAPNATRKLLMGAFHRHTLATHSMTGRPSPAFKAINKPVKEMLNPKIVADIIFEVTRKCNVSEKVVRNVITTKCADENKMLRMQMIRRAPMSERNH